MDMEFYQRETRQTAVYPEMEVPALYPALKISGEAGEISEHFGKIVRDDGGEITSERQKALHKELGDVLWYVARIADDLGMSLNSIAQANLNKLASRQDRGTLYGDGDDR